MGEHMNVTAELPCKRLRVAQVPLACCCVANVAHHNLTANIMVPNKVNSFTVARSLCFSDPPNIFIIIVGYSPTILIGCGLASMLGKLC